MTALRRPPIDALEADLGRLAALLRGEPDRVRPARNGADSNALEHLVDAFHLSSFERDLLVLCTAVELDPEFARLCAMVNGNEAAPYPTFGLALVRIPGSHFSALAPQAPLRRWRLIETGDGPILTATPLRIDERVLHYLVGVSLLDARLAARLEPLEAVDAGSLAPSHASAAQSIAALWSGAVDELPIVQVCGQSADCRPVSAAAAQQIGMRAALLTPNFMPREATELEAFVRLWEREIALGSFGVLLVEPGEPNASIGDDVHGRAHAIANLLDRLNGPIVVCARDPLRIVNRPNIVVEVRHPLPAEQRDTWLQALPEAVGHADIDAVVAQFDLSLPTIKNLAARSLACGERIWDACRAGLRSRLDTLAQRVDSCVDWDDLILPADQIVILRTIAAQLRQRLTVYERWGFACKSARGLGITALFTGPSGTGKTMAAEVLATELQLDLYRIDLSSVVSKYIGETEKNLRRVFEAAEESGAILLFDEADALFGKRSEVRDSHDRYANIEVGYLLQRMESYRGLAVLTTNMKSALDPAFLRRLRFVVQFPFPDTGQRWEIWKRAFPSLTPTEEIDFSTLANLTVAGGNIRNIALNAAFLAADAEQPVSMVHVLAATRGEYAKLERHLTAAESSGWS